jgi:hypothetical protein
VEEVDFKKLHELKSPRVPTFKLKRKKKKQDDPFAKSMLRVKEQIRSNLMTVPEPSASVLGVRFN